MRETVMQTPAHPYSAGFSNRLGALMEDREVRLGTTDTQPSGDVEFRIAPYLERYRNGEWRDTIFRDMILDGLPRRRRPLTIVDIGCGRGLDGEIGLQRSIRDAGAGTFIGVEPDQDIPVAGHFSHVYRSSFEAAAIPPGSVDLAYSAMVLEHIPVPQPFFDKLWEVLKVGGVFWGMTVDGRHWFGRCSKLLGALHLKEGYLRLLLGRRGDERYENYPVFYRSNTPESVRALACRFRRIECFNFARVGQCASYFPPFVRPLALALDERALRRNAPGTLLIVRLQK